MRNRRPVKDAHENDVINDFIAWLHENHGTRYEIMARPDPPDAVLQGAGCFLWVEHTDIYRSEDEAREEYEFALADPGETPFVHPESPVINPDERIAKSLLVNLSKKLTKTTYQEAFDQYGQGILILTERDPLFSNSSLTTIQSVLRNFVCEGDRGFFREAFLGCRGYGNLLFWRIYPEPDEIGIQI